MASISVAGNDYPLGELTGRKALALLRLLAIINSADATPDALASPDALAGAIGVCESFGVPASDLPLAVLIAAVRDIIAGSAVQWGEYLAGPVRAEIEHTNVLVQQVVAGLQGAGDGAPAK
jgi:hypothetical protein